MTFGEVLVVVWGVFLVAFLLGAALGRGSGWRAALAEASIFLEGEAVRWMLNGEDATSAQLWRLSGQVRHLGEPPLTDRVLGPAPEGR